MSSTPPSRCPRSVYFFFSCCFSHSLLCTPAPPPNFLQSFSFLAFPSLLASYTVHLLHSSSPYSHSSPSTFRLLYLLSLYPKHHRYHGRTLCDATTPGYSKDTGNSSCTYVKPCIPSIQTAAPLLISRDIVTVLKEMLCFGISEVKLIFVITNILNDANITPDI